MFANKCLDFLLRSICIFTKWNSDFEDEAAMMDLNDVDFDEDLGMKKEEVNKKLVKPKEEISMWVKAV